MIRLARYVIFVRYAQIEDYFRMGWVMMFAKHAVHHDHYGCELAWICNCRVPHRVPEASHEISENGRERAGA